MSQRKNLDGLLKQGDLSASQSAEGKAWEEAPACGHENGVIPSEESVELAIEQVIAQAGRAAAVRSKAFLDALGIDSAELQAWVNERVEIGSWPEGDLIRAFSEWKAKRPMHGA
ncbi:hypothetical protein LRS11_02915 [Pseudomonas sp. J452]|uniref:hypothetical protein n=1 Tax=Pseudomonas sp. J452 TaxID=2898441 RepID=UPI0021ADD85B|nr:hypothetical protein [Pseudomonas sp. J452]UUY09000.1 hypothetical protein LRS11_02915 [Pseudomonas sp. J452]